MTLNERITTQLKLIKRLVLENDKLFPNEKEVKEDDSPLIKAIKKGFRPDMVDKQTQTELTMAQIKEMEKKIKSVSEKLTTEKLIDTDTRGGKEK